jgi:hypothetical protein
MASPRRILISLSHSVSPAGVEAALASVWIHEPAEITGLFIEDLDVLNLGHLRVSREVRFADASARIPDAADMERQVQAYARRVRAAFETQVRSMNVTSSFRVTRGTLQSCLQEACADIDMLVIPAAREWMGQRILLRSHLPNLISGGPRTVILANPAPRARGGVAVLFEDTDAGRAALRTAVDISEAKKLAMTVLLPAVDAENLQRLHGAAKEVIGDCANVNFHRIASEIDATEIANATRRIAARALILPRDGIEARRRTAVDVLQKVDCSVILTG